MTTIRIFDIETTGIDPKEDRIVEIAAYDLLPDGSIARVGCDLIDPRRPIPPEASAVHHLTAPDLAGAPLFGAVWAGLYTPPAGTIYAAHNCEFEQGFLPTPAGVQWVCTYKCALRAWADAPGHSNQVLRYWRSLDGREGFDRDLARLAHRAEPDTYVTAWLLRDLLADATIETLIAWTKEPKVFPALTFGKHRGQKWAEVPADYLQWLRDGQHNMMLIGGMVRASSLLDGGARHDNAFHDRCERRGLARHHDHPSIRGPHHMDQSERGKRVPRDRDRDRSGR